jgi:CheY-like chemotaxis protein
MNYTSQPPIDRFEANKGLLSSRSHLTENPPVAASDIRIFLAEDHEGDVFLVRRALSRMHRGYNLTVARNGEDALALLNQLEIADGDRPDLIVLDLNLPRINGLELLSRIRAVDNFRKIPIIIFTSSDSPRDRELAMSLGANLYVRKPTDLNSFMKLGVTIEEIISNS